MKKICKRVICCILAILITNTTVLAFSSEKIKIEKEDVEFNVENFDCEDISENHKKYLEILGYNYKTFFEQDFVIDDEKDLNLNLIKFLIVNYEVLESLEINSEEDLYYKTMDILNLYYKETGQPTIEVSSIDYYSQDAFSMSIPDFRKLGKKAAREAIITASNLSLAVADTVVASALLSHACQDNPRTMNYRENTHTVYAIQNTKVYKDTLNKFKRSGCRRCEYDMTFTPSNSSLDLHLAFNVVKHKIAFNRSNGNCYLEDIYDFDEKSYEEAGKSITQKFANFLNNRAVRLQNMGVLNPYKVTVLFKYK